MTTARPVQSEKALSFVQIVRETGSFRRINVNRPTLPDAGTTSISVPPAPSQMVISLVILATVTTKLLKLVRLARLET